MQSLEITVVGAGYVGLSTAIALALAGHKVHVFERNPERLLALQQGIIPFAEPLLEVVLHNLENSISFTADLAFSLASSSMVMLAVGTPPTPAQGVDLSQVFDAVLELAPFLNFNPRVIVLKSTVPVGTSEEITTTLKSLVPKAVFSVSSNPEFLRQGRALRDAVFPDRIVFGSSEAWALEQLELLYAPIIEGLVDVPVELEPFRPTQPIPVLRVSNAVLN
jgi:UDPglucose 6-dehydrogenase